MASRYSVRNRVPNPKYIDGLRKEISLLERENALMDKDIERPVRSQASH